MKCNKWIWGVIWLSINRLQWQQFESVVIGVAICFHEKKKRKERRKRYSIQSLEEKVDFPMGKEEWSSDSVSQDDDDQ